MTQLNNPHDTEIKLTLSMARNNLRNFFNINGGTDAQLIRTCLSRFTDLQQITHYKDLVLLRWATILLEHLPIDEPDHSELQRLLYDARSRASDIF